MAHGLPIQKSFDFTSLAYLLNTLHCAKAAMFAQQQDAKEVIKVLSASDPDRLVALNTALAAWCRS
jgi:hypothetical protein